MNNEFSFESAIKNRSIKVVKVFNNDIENLIRFEETWFKENDLLENISDKNKDIELIKKIDNRTFTYRGDAKVNEFYCIKHENYV